MLAIHQRTTHATINTAANEESSRVPLCSRSQACDERAEATYGHKTAQGVAAAAAHPAPPPPRPIHTIRQCVQSCNTPYEPALDTPPDATRIRLLL